MGLFIKLAFCFLIGFFACIIIAPIVIYFLKREKAKQTILSYVDFHDVKQGTPTMGGIIFVLAIMISSIILFEGNILFSALATVIVFMNFLVGFVDDFIKVKYEKNEGLTPIQKIVFQFIVALGAGALFYLNGCTKVVVPFSNIILDVKYFIIPLTVVVFLATTNAVNLTDGLDALASSMTIIYMLAITTLISINSRLIYITDISLNMQILSVVSAGALFGFIFFNGYPAKVFMGDSGSIALGGLVATVSIITGNMLYILFLGMVYVITTLSVIIQVLHYKRTKKRVFLMAPLHHHFEKKGMHEVKIVTMYIIFSTIISLITLIIEYFI